MTGSINHSENTYSSTHGTSGGHSISSTAEEAKTARKTTDVANKVFKGTFMASAGASIAIGALVLTGVLSFGIVPAIILAVGAGVVGVSGALYLAAKVHQKVILSRSIGLYEDPNPVTEEQIITSAKGMPLPDTKQSFEWKKRLIQSAEKSIVLSGNYCGGGTFDEILDLITVQMSKKPNLEVVLLSSDQWISDENKGKIRFLEENYPNRFMLAHTNRYWSFSPGLKVCTNHVKGLSIDGGKYFLLGGSGLEDKYARATGLGDRDIKVKEQTYSDQSPLDVWITKQIARGFRDMDFVFKSATPKNGEVTNGQILHQELLKLAFRWQKVNQEMMHESADTKLIEKMIRDPESFVDKTTVKEFDRIVMMESTRKSKSADKIATTTKKWKAEEGELEIFTTGPGMTESPYLKAIIDRVNHAKREIYIDQMFFHPPKELLDALAAAADRGVKIFLVTNGYDEKFSPTAHSAFGDRNRYEYQKLCKKVKPENRENIKVYEFGDKHTGSTRKTTLHKKVMVVDDTVIAGSGNCGYKSLTSTSDDEINFIFKCAKFAQNTIQVIREDARHRVMVKVKVNKSDPELTKDQIACVAHRVEQPERELSLSAKIRAFKHMISAPLIG